MSDSPKKPKIALHVWVSAAMLGLALLGFWGSFQSRIAVLETNMMWVMKNLTELNAKLQFLKSSHE